MSKLKFNTLSISSGIWSIRQNKCASNYQIKKAVQGYSPTVRRGLLEDLKEKALIDEPERGKFRLTNREDLKTVMQEITNNQEQ